MRQGRALFLKNKKKLRALTYCILLLVSTLHFWHLSGRIALAYSVQGGRGKEGHKAQYFSKLYLLEDLFHVGLEYQYLPTPPFPSPLASYSALVVIVNTVIFLEWKFRLQNSVDCFMVVWGKRAKSIYDGFLHSVIVKQVHKNELLSV